MSIKLRVTLWFTLMVLLLAGLMLAVVLVFNETAVIDDPAERLVKVVLDNADDVEFDNGRFDWDDLHSYRRGVSCCFFNENGEYLHGAKWESWNSDLPLESGILRRDIQDEEEILVYDCYVDMSVTGLWIRGMVSAEDTSGFMQVIVVLTIILLPILLVLSTGGGWLIAKSAFKPMDDILSAAEAISDGRDLSSRLALKKGPSEMRRLADSFDSMFARLERSFQAERQFASDASHELRTPLTVIMAQCDRAKRKDKSREDFLSSVSVIEEQARNMSALVQSLLSLTRMQQGTERYALKRAGLSDFVRSCGEDFSLALGRGIKLSMDVEDGIACRYNQELMSRLIRNLLENACKYGRENGHIELSLKRDGEKISLSVADDGIGIAKEDQDKIWQRFWQADSSRGEDGGSGLGLAMVKEIAHFHGGEMSLESEPGRGSRFTLTLPT